MADHAASNSMDSGARQMDYYCHDCLCRVSGITEEFKCPSCNSGFVEEIESNERPDNSNDLFSIFSTGGGNGDLPNENFLNILSEMNLFHGQNANSVNLGRFISNVLSGASPANGGGQFIRLLHGNPDDYVWSTDGLDSVITQLLNQIDNAGPPPMSPEEINNLNEITVSKEHIHNKIQCPICMEDFVLEEKVKELSCHHFFHNDCIVEWLKLHATCPTCRTNLTSEKTQNANSPTSASTTATTNLTTIPENATTSSSASTTNRQSAGGYNFNDDDLD